MQVAHSGASQEPEDSWITQSQMPNAADIQVSKNLSTLLIGDGGTHKTYYIGTCPGPIWVGDFDKGMAVHAGRADIDYDTFRDMPDGEKVPTGSMKDDGWYLYGHSWPAFLKKINEIGRSIDTGTCKYLTLGIDSLTMAADSCWNYIIKNNPGVKDGRQIWGLFLENMTALFSQLTGWPLIKVLTAHVQRNENLVTNTVEKLPLIGGKSSGKIPVMFDEVYYTSAKDEIIDSRKPAEKTQVYRIITTQDGIHKQAKSRALNIPNGTLLDYKEIMKAAAAARPK